MTATIRNAEVTRFVEAVRQALDDLTPDEVDELTGGLEADLDDALADDPAAGVERFGSAADYADELRAAAGLPPRAARGGRRGAGSLVDRVETVQRGWQERLDRLRARRWWSVVRDFLVTLRPVWWVARGWAAYEFVAAVLGRGEARVLPITLSGLVLLGLLIVVSVEAGRRWTAAGTRPPHAPTGWLRRWAPRALNAVAVVLLLGFGSSVELVQYLPGPSGENVVVPPSNGLWLNGTEVRNVFPYDANGRPLTDVQLFDENGRSLSVGTSAQTPLTDQTGPYLGQRATRQVPAVDANNRPVWNVFPLRQQAVEPGADTDPNTGSTVDRPISAPTPARAPMQTLLPVAPPLAAASPQPSEAQGSGAAAPPVSAAPTGSAAPQVSPTGSPRS